MALFSIHSLKTQAKIYGISFIILLRPASGGASLASAKPIVGSLRYGGAGQQYSPSE